MNTNELLDILGEAEIALLKALAAEPIDRRSIGHARVRVTHAIETLRPEVHSAGTSEPPKIVDRPNDGNFCECNYKCGDHPGWEDRACREPHGMLWPLPTLPRCDCKGPWCEGKDRDAKVECLGYQIDSDGLPPHRACTSERERIANFQASLDEEIDP